VAVEELNTVTNVLRKSWARERCTEWFKVQFKHEVAIGAALSDRLTLSKSKHTRTEQEIERTQLKASV